MVKDMKFNSQKKKTLTVMIGVLLILSLNFFDGEVKGFFYSVSSPIQKLFWGIGDRVSDFLSAVFQAEDFKKENEKLKIELQEVLTELNYLRESRKENQILREGLEIGLQREFRLIISEVVGKDLTQDSILVDRGFRDGVLKDMPVITQQKALLGRVAEVYDKFSRVLLISSKKSSFDARISESDISGVVKGQGGAELRLEFIPQDKEVKEGDLIVSSSLGGIYPSGLIVGLVKDIEKSDLEPFQRAELSPFFDIKNLEKIFIVVDY